MAKNRIWIELDVPENDQHAELQCELANKMLGRLGDTGGQKFSLDGRHYCYGNNMGAIQLIDRGHWFNLDYLGRDG